MMNEETQKRRAARAALDYIAQYLPAGAVLGVGTGSTANLFIDMLPDLKARLSGAVASSEATRLRLEALGIPVIDLNDVTDLPFYVDGADEINPELAMIKGGGGALTREKIVASVAKTFVCIADARKAVPALGRFPLPLEVIQMAVRPVSHQIEALGGTPRLRARFVTDSGHVILDAHGLAIDDPTALETRLNQIPGVVTNGLFAARGADILFLGTDDGVLCKTAR